MESHAKTQRDDDRRAAHEALANYSSQKKSSQFWLGAERDPRRLKKKGGHMSLEQRRALIVGKFVIKDRK